MTRWEHKVGDCIDHVAGKMTAVVVGRNRTLAGGQIYNIRLVDLASERRDRVLREQFTLKVNLGGERCTECRFWELGKCARSLEDV